MLLQSLNPLLTVLFLKAEINHMHCFSTKIVVMCALLKMSCLHCSVVHYHSILEEPFDYDLRTYLVSILILFHFPTILVKRMALSHLLFYFIFF